MESAAKRVLCVDDDPATLKLRKFLLEAAGYKVYTAASAVDALAILADHAGIELVLLDYLMPGMKGDELAERLRHSHPDLRMIAISEVGQLPAAFLKDVDRSIQKGQDPEVVLAVIAEVLARPPAKREVGAPPAGIILCVEDEELQLQLRKMQFESEGFHVLAARSGSAALEIFRSQPVDAVVMDYWLSGSNGTTIAEEMKRLRPKTPIVMLSGFTSLPGEGAVVDAWLRKSHVESDDIVNTVRRLIEFRLNARAEQIRTRTIATE
jgi:CheY-like chemotaxis protein